MHPLLSHWGATGMASRFWGTLNWPAFAALRLPERIPDLRGPWLAVFQLFWFAALLLAIVGPIAGTYHRFTATSENSALMIGSRAGLVLSEDDLTHVRFPVGTAAKAAGVQPGDEIVAVEGLPLSKIVPLNPTQAEQPSSANETDYALLSPLIEAGEPIELNLTLRSRSGEIRNFHVRTGEQHIEEGSRAVGLSPAFLSVVDLFHVLTYPFLLLAAWILHRRKREDLISSVLSLAILLTIGSEQPSATFLTFVAHISETWHRHIYDLGNICLLAGILLFPFGQLRPRIVIPILAFLPLLFFLSGDLYRLTFVIFMVAGVLTLLARLRSTPPSAARQQIKWALFGFSGYSLFLSIALTSDMMKLTVGSLGMQLALEVIAGLTFGLAFLSLQLGLLVALMRYRLYDAESVISRSANFALITLLIGGVFAGLNEAVKVFVQGLYGPDAGNSPGIFAAAVATVLVNPAYERIQAWSERKFQFNLVILRDELPEVVRDMRETATLGEIVEEVLARIIKGIRTTHVAAIIDQGVFRTRGIAQEKVEAWKNEAPGWDCGEDICDSSDRLFPIRVPLRPTEDAQEPLGFILVGPRPDGSGISKDEQKALAQVAEPVARAIRNVIKRVSQERRIEDLIEDNRRRIEDLEARLAGPSVAARPSSRSA